MSTSRLAIIAIFSILGLSQSIENITAPITTITPPRYIDPPVIFAPVVDPQPTVKPNTLNPACLTRSEPFRL